VTLLRTDKKTGKLQQMLAGTVLSDAEGGVVFQDRGGYRGAALLGAAGDFPVHRRTTDLAASPTLSVQVRSPAPATATVTLSYLARGFDWAADYVATLSADGKTMDLGAWVTLANGNGVGFPDAHTQVVAGRVNRESGEVEPLDIGAAILAQCWPRGSTSDQPPMRLVLTTRGMAMDRMDKMALPAAAGALQEVMLTGARRMEQEQLGDLKLYRVPDRTTVASRQSKQVRLLDRSGIPVRFVYGADIAVGEQRTPGARNAAAADQERCRESAGTAAAVGPGRGVRRRQGAQLLQHESDMRDLAVDEDMEINLGESADVQVAVRKETRRIDPKGAHSLPLLPGVTLRSVQVDDFTRVEVSNARAGVIHFELRLRLPEGAAWCAPIIYWGPRMGGRCSASAFRRTAASRCDFKPQHTADTVQRP
jgi:hypothetical protein